MRIGTIVTRAGLPQPARGGPFVPGPVFAGTYHTPGEPAHSPYVYGRYHNPTWSHYEEALRELEGGRALAFPSGMAAMAAVMGTVLKPGDVVVMPSDGYYTGRMIAEGYFTAMGVQVRKAPTADGAQTACLEGARLLWLESPSNPGLEVCDIAVMARLAHDAGALVAVDNTTPTVLGQRPLALGADFSVASDTKALTGHSDLILGHVACGDNGWAERLLTWRTQMGVVPGPMEVWLAHRSLLTADLRQARQCANARAVAEFLVGRDDVLSVRYPGLPEDPSHATAARQMERFGPVLNFTLADRGRADRFLEACRLVLEATSFGGIQTVAERRARWGGDAVPEGFIRLSAGCEDVEDILEDLEQALDRASGGRRSP